jgi:hypothetical protein
MSDAERVRALLAEAASVGSGSGWTLGGDALRGILHAVDATILPRTLRFTLVDTVTDRRLAQPEPGALCLIAAERRVKVLVGPAPSGLAAADAARFDTPLAFDDDATLAGVAQVLSAWVESLSCAAVKVTEAPPDDGAAAGMSGMGLAATTIAQALGVELWPDRSLPARLEAWMPEVWQHAVAGAGFGALAGPGLSHGDETATAALARALAQFAPDGLPTTLTRGLADGRTAGLVAFVDEDGRSLMIVGSAEAGLAVLATDEALPDLVRIWQQV